MEKVKAWEKNILINELTQGMEFVNLLKKQIDPLASPEECDLLLGRILTSLDKSLSILDSKTINKTIGDPSNSCSSSSSVAAAGVGKIAKSTTEGSELDNLKDQGRKMVFKKRKITQKWSTQVRITELEGSLDDGYSWRKYGQKDILGANHPRAYYRCTHRDTQGCLATKQVQKSDEDPLIFEVTYKGNHSCKTSQSTFISAENQKKNLNHGPSHEIENFTSTPRKTESANDHFFVNSMEPFTSSTTSESTYLSLLPNQKEEFEMDQFLQRSESDHVDFMLTPTSVINSPFCGEWDSSADDQLDNIDPNLMFDISEFFT